MQPGTHAKSLWKFCLQEDVSFTIFNSEVCNNYFNHIDKPFHHTWFSIEFNTGSIRFTIRKGYAWDGCTPKFKIFGKIVGVWDGFYDSHTHLPDTYYASLIHDTLCQFMNEHPISRDDADKIFLWLLQRHNFVFSYLYYFAVRAWLVLLVRPKRYITSWIQSKLKKD